MHKAKTAEAYFKNAPQWRDELLVLRKALLAAGLTETVKWGGPVYTLDGVNVVGLAAFKSYVGLWFFQGALLKDPAKILINAQEGVTKAQRQWRMASMQEVRPALVTKYAKEAAALARDGVKVERSAPKPLVMPAELKAALAADKRAAAAFKAMTPGCQREYADYVSEAKQPATRDRRVEKILPMIAAGGGLNDRYKKNG